jgi:hypothetical protein
MAKRAIRVMDVLVNRCAARSTMAGSLRKGRARVKPPSNRPAPTADQLVNIPKFRHIFADGRLGRPLGGETECA